MKILACVVVLLILFLVVSIFLNNKNKGKGSSNHDPVIIPPKVPEIVTEDLEEGEGTETEREVKRETDKGE